MNNAFVRETDSDVVPDGPGAASLLPNGAKNYLTPSGAKRLHDELTRLVEMERSSPVETQSDSVSKRKLQAADHRIHRLREILDLAEIVPPPLESRDVIGFGATVVVEDEDGELSSYRLVGLDEAEPDEGAVAWNSPIGHALINKRRGDRLKLRTPFGDRELEILHVEY